MPPVARIGAAGAARGQYIYVANGYDEDENALNRLDRYDTVGGQWVSLAAPGSASAECALVATDTSLFLFSPWTNNRKYDISSNQWSTIANQTYKCENLSAVWDGSDTIYLLGGYRGSDYQRYVYAYSISGKQFFRQKLICLPGADGAGHSSTAALFIMWAGKTRRLRRQPFIAPRCSCNLDMEHPPAIPEARSYYGGAYLGGKFWVTGGLDARESVKTTVLVYDPDTNTWDTGKPSMPSGRVIHLAIAADDGRIYVVTGSDGATYYPQDWVYEEAASEFYSYCIAV
jgi:N-acetylneuraminic acid mutarotase